MILFQLMMMMMMTTTTMVVMITMRRMVLSMKCIITFSKKKLH